MVRNADLVSAWAPFGRDAAHFGFDTCLADDLDEVSVSRTRKSASLFIDFGLHVYT